MCRNYIVTNIVSRAVIAKMALVIVLAGFCAPAVLWGSQSGADTTTMMTTDEIVLGMSTALSGPTAQLGRHMRDGVQLALSRYNSTGGIHGRKLRLITYDDGYEPYRVAPNMSKLIDEDNVLAIIGNVGTPTAIASLPIIREKRVLFFAPFTGAGLLRKKPPERYVINYRASYKQEITAMVDALIDQAGLHPEQIAFFTQRDGYGDAGYVSGFSALKQHGLTDDLNILHVRYERNTVAVENALADLLMSRNDTKAVIMVGAYAPCAKFITLAKQAGLKALFLNVSFVGSELLLQKLGNQYCNGVIVTQVVPVIEQHGTEIVQQYLADLQQFTPENSAEYVGLEGYISARLLLHAISTIKVAPSRENIISALEQIGSFDLGFGCPITLSPLQHQASNQVWATQLTDNTIAPFNWHHIKQLLKATVKR